MSAFEYVLILIQINYTNNFGHIWKLLHMPTKVKNYNMFKFIVWWKNETFTCFAAYRAIFCYLSFIVKPVFFLNLDGKLNVH